MKRLLLILLCLWSVPAFAQPIGNVSSGQATQNMQDKGVRSIDQALIIPLLDTAQVNNVLSRLPSGTRKLGAFGRVGSRLWWFVDGRWQPTSDGSAGGGSMDYDYVNNAVSNTLTIAKEYTDSLVATAGADGNNYVTGVSFTDGSLIVQRNGLGNLSVTIDGRYSLIGHTHTIAEIATLQQKLDDLQAQISGGGTAYTGSNGVQVNGTTISLTDKPYTTAEQTKLAGIAPNATANSTDAILLSRSNHTGTQAISTVNGLQSALDARLNRSDSNSVYVTPFSLASNYFNRSQADSRYLQNESDPQWNAQKVNYPTLTYANATYAPAAASYILGSVDYAQIPVGTGSQTVAGSNTFTRVGSSVRNMGDFVVADSSKGVVFDVPGSSNLVRLTVDNSGNIIRQVISGTDTNTVPAAGVDATQIVTLTGNQTVINKTFNAPIINNPTGIGLSDIAGLNSALAGKEPVLTAPNLTGRYLTGFKTFGSLNSDSVSEGTNNLFYTLARDNSAFDTRLATKSTTNLAEGTNLYFNNGRARAAVSATGPGLSYNSITGVFTSTALITEVDPLFTASPASTITNTNKTNWQAGYDKRLISLAFSGTTTKTLTATLGDNSTVTASFADLQGSGGGSGTIASTSNVLKGDNAGNAIAATPGTDYLNNITGLITPGSNVTITGAGTSASPYNISATGGGGGGSVDTTGTQYSAVTGYQIDTAKTAIRSFNGVKRWGEIQAAMDAQTTPLVSGGLLGSAANRNGTATGGIWNSNIDYSTIIKSTASIAYACATASNSNANVATQYPTVIRGNKITSGGFEYMQDFAVSAFNSDSRLFVGLTAQPGGSGMVGINPSGSFTDMIGFAKDAGDAFPSIMYNDNSGTAIKTPLTTQKAISTNAIYTVRISCARSSTSCKVRVTEHTWATGDVDLFNGTVTSSTDLPRQTIPLAQFCGIGNGTNTTSQIVLNFMRLRVETDY